MPFPARLRWSWMDLLWLVFLGGLAALPPIREIHKQMILAGLGAFQLLEGRILAAWPNWGRAIAVGGKVALATLLIGHTGEVAINSSYYPIFFVPVVTAAMFFGPRGTLGWTAVASGAYCSYLWPALRVYRFNAAGGDELALRVFFFFLLAVIINRFVMETRAASEQLLLAQAETRRAERLAALGQMSAGLAHEIRNPLAVIKGSAEMLGKASDPALASELAGYIVSEVDRVNALVTRFLDFARPLQLKRESVSLPGLLDEAVEDAERRWPDSGVRVEREYAPTLQTIPVDEMLMERAFANLVGNAFEAMTPAGGTLRISARKRPEGIEITFADTGPGVPVELREQIFNPFFTTKPTGVGLGLAIVAKIVDQHGGQLRLGAGEGMGARFEVFLPYANHIDR